MFACDRFKYETPNVIDPGDAPPSHPSRSSAPWEPSEDIRSKAARLLHESGKSSFSFIPKRDAFSFEEEDDVEIRGSQLPSVEDARMYAVSVLSHSTERLRSSPIFIRQPKGDSSAESLPLSMERTLKIPTASQRLVRQRCNCRIVMCMILVAVALAATLLGILVAFRNPASPSSPTGASSRFQQALIVLGQEVSSATALYTEGTPQYKAADWIANRDQLQYPIPSILSADSNRFLQRYVLAVLYFSMNGDAWKSNVNFLSASDECGWSDVTVVELGITCSTSLQVQGIKLYENNLSGSLPEELQYLTGLQYLSLRGNEITGSIPSSFRTLSQLAHIDVRHNQLVGRFPSWIGQWKKLQALGLSDNLFTGHLPSGLSGLTQLTTLALDLNELEGSLIYVSKLTNLQYVYLDSNHFTGKLDDGLLDSWQNVVELTMSDNSLESTNFPSVFLSFPKLRLIDLSLNAIAGSLPQHIPSNTMLEYLTIDENNIGGTIPSSITSLSALKQLDLSQNQLTGSIPYALSNVPNLQYLFMDQNKFTPAPLPQFLGTMTQLLELSLADARITGTLPYWIKSLKSLVSLDLRRNSLEGTIPSSLWEMTSLQYLLLSTNSLKGGLPTDVPLSNLHIAALHENFLSGNAAGFCNNNIPTMTYDCKKVTCTCCNLGCCRSGFAGSCYDNVTWVNDLGLLEHNYTLTAFGF